MKRNYFGQTALTWILLVKRLSVLSATPIILQYCALLSMDKLDWQPSAGLLRIQQTVPKFEARVLQLDGRSHGWSQRNCILQNLLKYYKLIHWNSCYWITSCYYFHSAWFPWRHPWLIPSCSNILAVWAILIRIKCTTIVIVYRYRKK